MEISFGSYKMRLEILLLCVFIIWVMFGHILCSCSTINLTEGLTIRTTLGPNTTTKEEKNLQQELLEKAEQWKGSRPYV